MGSGSSVNVFQSLPIQRSGVRARLHQGAKRPYSYRGVFSFAIRRYGSCAWETFGSAGFLDFRSLTPRTAATLPVRGFVDSHQIKERKRCVSEIRPEFLPSSSMDRIAINLSVTPSMGVKNDQTRRVENAWSLRAS